MIFNVKISAVFLKKSTIKTLITFFANMKNVFKVKFLLELRSDVDIELTRVDLSLESLC